jgi:hypothetical protein
MPRHCRGHTGYAMSAVQRCLGCQADNAALYSGAMVQLHSDVDFCNAFRVDTKHCSIK